MSRFTYSFKLLRDFGRFARENKAWWIVPLVLVLLLLVVLVVAGQSATPFVYTLF